MADINSNILINIDTTQAMSALRGLDKQISALNRSMIVGTKAASLAQADFAKSLLHNVNATGMFNASMGKMATSTDQFSKRLESGKLSLREYYRYGMASTKTFGKNYAREFQTISNLAEKRVKALQSQYVQLGKDAQGAIRSMRITPKALNYNDALTRMSMTIQRQQIMNKLLDDGATKLLNFGKNTQWAGRQLMVGFTIPLAMFAGSAIKAFKEIETQAIRFKKVYGDIFTTQDDTDKALKNMKDIAKEYTKYGLKVSETIKMAADAAAAGNSGQQLETVVKQANKLAVLGGVAQDKALETTIALQNAFQIGSGELSKTMDFLNSVENQTVLSLEDLSNAIPRVAPVIKQLGGDVKDLAFFLTAMKEGGISAEQGANALKSGLASLINPSKAATEATSKLGINLKGIIESNQGNLKNTVVSFAQALQPLTDLQRAQTIEKVFGKYQFSRISALLNNVTKEGNQASRVLKLASASAEELALLSERELKTQESSPMYKMQAAIEKLKASIAPIGELFAKVLTPVINFFVKLFDKFNNAPEGIKKAVAIIVAAVAGIGPVLLMTVGLVANGLANLMKMFNLIRKGFQGMAYGSKDAALGTQYLSNEELENIAVSNSLATAHKSLSSAYVLESASLVALTNAYREAKVAMSSFASTNPGMFMPSRARITPPRRFAKGVTSVPGTGNKDTTPALLTPGEAVIPADMAKKYAPFIGQMIDGTLPGHFAGRLPLFLGMPKSIKAVTDQRNARLSMESIGKATEASRFAKVDPTDFGVQLEATTGHSFPVKGIGGLYQKPDGTKVFVKPYVDETAALAEERMATITREAFPLKAPEHTIRTMIDPTDPLKKRKIIVSEAPYNPQFAKPEGKFDKDDYFSQLLASTVRGDKDLQIANVSGKNVVDQGNAGVFDTASGFRTYSKQMPSIEEQARINLLGVKGSNTKRFFAEATADIPKGMSAEAYSRRMLDEIDATLPKLKNTIASFKLNKDEEAIYQNMIRRLEDAKNANWREIHGIHSSVIKSTKKPLTPAAIKKIEDEIALRARQKGHASSLSDKDFMEGFAKWAQGNGFAKGGIVPGYMAGRMPLFGPSATAIRVSGAEQSAAKSMFSAGASSVSKSLFSRIAKKPQGDNTEFDVDGIKFTVTPKNLKSVEEKIAENEMYWKSKGLNDEQILEAFKAKMFSERGIRKISGKTVTASDVASVLGSGGRGRSSNVTSSAKKRRSLYKDKTIYKDQQKFIDEEEAYLREALPADVLATITQPAKKITLPDGTTMSLQRYIRETGDTSSFYSSRALSHKSPAAKRMRNAEDDLPEHLFEDTQAMNQALVYYGNAEHPQSRAQAMALLTQVHAKRNSSETFTNFDRYLETALPYRIEKGYYEKFGTASRQDNLIYANKGLFSVPGPKGAGDIQPAMLSPGEAVIPAKAAAKYSSLVSGMINGTIPEHGTGRGGKGGIPRPLPGYTMVDKGDGWGATPVANTPAPSRGADVLGKATAQVGRFASTLANGTKAVANNARVQSASAKAMDRVRKIDARLSAMGGPAGPGGPGGPGGPAGPKPHGGYWTGYGKVATMDQDGKALSKEQRINARQDYRMKSSQTMMGVGMAAMMIPMLAQGIAQGAPDSTLGKAAANNMPAIIGASMLPMILPLLNSPLKKLIATILAVGVAFKMQGMAIRKSIADGVKQGKSIGNTVESLEGFGSILGTMSATQIMDKKREANRLEITPIDQTFGKDFSGSEFGKQFIAEFNSYAKQNALGSAKQLGTKLASAVSQGVLSADQAESIIVNIARDMEDKALEIEARGFLREIIGPDGKDLKDNPVEVQLKILNSQKQLTTQMQNIFSTVVKREMQGWWANKLQGLPGAGVLGINTKIDGGEAGQLLGSSAVGATIGLKIASQLKDLGLISGGFTGVGGRGASTYGNIKTAASLVKGQEVAGTINKLKTGASLVRGAAAVGTASSATGAGAIPGAIILASTFAADIALRKWQQGKEKKAVGAVSGALAGNSIQSLTQVQQSMDLLQMQADTQIEKLTKEKELVKTAEKRLEIEKKIKDINDKNLKDQQELRSQGVDVVNQSTDFLDVISSKDAKVKYAEAYQTAFEDKYKDAVGPEKLAATNLSALLNPDSGRIPKEAGISAETRKELNKQRAESEAKVADIQTRRDSFDPTSGEYQALQKEYITEMINLTAIIQGLKAKTSQDVTKIGVMVQASVVAGDISASSAEALIESYIATGKNIETTWKLMMDGQGLAEMDSLGWILQNLTDQKNINTVVNVAGSFNGKEGPQEARQFYSILEDFIQLPPEFRIDLNIESDPDDIPFLKKLGKEVDALRKHFPGGKLTKAALIKYQAELKLKNPNETNEALEVAIKNWNLLSSYDPTLQLEASITLNELLISDNIKEEIDKELIEAYKKKGLWKELGTGLPGFPVLGQAEQLKSLNQANPDLAKSVAMKAYKEYLDSIYGPKTADLKKLAAQEAADTLKGAYSFIDDLAMKLKLFRDSAFNALTPLKSIMAAFTNTKDAESGLGRMFEKFKGLQQIMLEGGVSSGLMDAISGMSAKEFEAFKNSDVNPSKEKVQKPFELDDKGNVKGVTKDLLGLSEAFNSVVVGMAQFGAAQSIDNIKKQREAFEILRGAGMSVTDALKVIEDQSLASAIAAGTLGAAGSAEMKKFIADIAAANSAMEKMQVITDTLAKNAEFDVFAKTPEVVSAMKSMGYSVDQIDAVLGNPAMLKQFTQNIKDGKIDIAAIEGSTGAISDFLKDVEAKKLIDIQINFNKGDYAQVASSGLDMVNQMFAVQEDLIRTGVDPDSTQDVARLSANEKLVKKLQEDLRPYEAQIEQLQYKINDIQAEVSLQISQQVEKYQEEINDLQHEIDIQFNEPIQALQDQASVLSHDMDLISHAAEQVNKRYDQQAESLSTIKDINDAILSQQEKQISLSDALTSGDISAAGKAMQDMRKANADLYANAAQKSFELARKNELARLVGTQGLNEEQIKEKQYQISQDIYALETDPKKINYQDQIKAKTASIYVLEEAREASLSKIQEYENEIAKITKDHVVDKERMITALNTENEIIQARLDKLVEETTVLGKNRDAWAAIEAKIKSYDLSRKDLDTAFAALLASSTAINTQWESIMTKIGAYAATPAKDSKIMTTAQTIVTNSGSTASVSKSEAAATAATDTAAADAKAKAEADAKTAADASAKSKAEAEALLAAALKAAEDAEAKLAAAVKAEADAKAALKALNDATTAAEKAAAQKILDAADAAKAKAAAAQAEADAATAAAAEAAAQAATQAATDAADAAIAAAAAAAIAEFSGEASDYAISVITGIGDDLVDSSNALIAGSDATVAAFDTMVEAADTAGQAFIAIANGTKEYLKYLLMTDDQLYKATANAVTSSYTGDTASIAKGADANYDANGPKNFYAGHGQTGNSKDALVDKSGGISSYGPSTQNFFTVDGQPYSGRLIDTGNGSVSGISVNGVPVWLPDLPGGKDWGKYITKASGAHSQFLASGGYAMGTDTVPAMLTPGEFVMSKYAVNTHGVDRMKAINNGNSVGDAVYNYSISVNVKSDANPDEIARSVMAQIKQIDSQKIRGSRF